MSKGIKQLSVFIVLLCILLIQITSVSGKENDDNAIISNTTVSNTIISNPIVNDIYPQNCSPDIELQTSYISDTLEAGKTYVYKVQVKNVDDKDITIDPRISANNPIFYPMVGQAVAGQTSNVVMTTAVQESNNTSATNVTPIVSAPAMSGAMPMTSTGINDQAFDNSAVNISAPTTIGAGEVIDMMITVNVPDNSTGSYNTNIDMNVNNQENNQYNPQLGLSFTVRQPLTVPYVKTFSTIKDAPIIIDISADKYNSDMGIRISPKIEDPSFSVGLTCNDDPVNLTLIKSVDNGNIGTGTIYPTWVSTTENIYQDYGEHHEEIYKLSGTIGDYKLSILPKNTNSFGYSITLGDSNSTIIGDAAADNTTAAYNTTLDNKMIDNLTDENVTKVNSTVEEKQPVIENDNVTESDNGKSINLKNGETFYLKLRENPSTGYSWLLNLSKGLCILSDNYTQDPAPPGYVGVPGTHLWIIKAVTHGHQQVKGIYKQPWMETTGTEANFTLDVEVM
jgi:predicted secreted protein